MDLDHALEAHVLWKVRFRMAMLDQGSVDAEAAGGVVACDLGRWLQAEGRERLGGLVAFSECEARHRDFHAAAGRVARAINAGRLEEASRLLKPTETFTLSSAALGRAIVDLLRASKAGAAGA
ncbi:MAG: CZB domain-containing protein [Holophagaceae bacterium]